MKIESIGDGLGPLLLKEWPGVGGFGSVATVTGQDETMLISSQPHYSRKGWAQAAQQISERGGGNERQGGHASDSADHVARQLLLAGRRARRRVGRYVLETISRKERYEQA